MSKSHRLNVRFPARQFHALERCAHLKGLPASSHVRSLIDRHLKAEGRLLILELAPDILGASVCSHRLLIALGAADDLPELARKTRRLAGRMGVGDV